MPIYCMGCKNLYEENETLRRRIDALKEALKTVRRVQRTPRSGWQGMLDRMIEIIDAALLADEQSAGNAGGTNAVRD